MIPNEKEVVSLIELTMRTKLRPLVLAHAGNIHSTMKEDGTPQTAVDVEAEKILRDELSRTFPDLVHYGEESGYPSEMPDSYWLLDCIDGTKSFLKGIPAYTAMAVHIKDDMPVTSIIYDYTKDTMYNAYKSEGAFRNGKPLRIVGTLSVKHATCRERMVERMNALFQRIGIDIECIAGPSGAGYGFTQVVEGKSAARFNFPHRPGNGHVHDYAPGFLLVTEAGGTVVPIDGGDSYNLATKSFVACHPSLGAIIRDHVNEIRAIENETA